MARMIPPLILDGCASPGEKEVFYRLHDGAETDEWIVLHSLCLAEHVRQVSGEIDFVVVIPEMGVLCLEVKACTRLRRSNGLWYYGTDPNADPRGPFRQAAEAMHSLRAKLVKAQPDLASIVFWSAAVFPYVAFEEESPEWHKWQSIDRPKFRARPFPESLMGVMENARRYLVSCKTARWFAPTAKKPTFEECQRIAHALRGDFEIFESAVSARQRRETEILRFTEEQYYALDAMQSNKQVIFAGPAGTGKTVLALEAARRSAALGLKTLFLCFNRNLGQFIRTASEGFGKELRAQTLHGLMVDFVGHDAVPSDTPQSYWTRELPNLASLRAIGSEDHAASYDLLIVDEAQDILREEYLEFLDLLLRGGLKAGNWMMFGDFEKQAIYGGHSLESVKRALALSFPVYTLSTNCRNTPRVAATAHLLGGLNPDYARVLRPDKGPESDPVYRFYDSPSRQQENLVEALERLYGEGFRGSDVVILSPFSASKAAAASLSKEPWNQRVRPLTACDRGHVPFTTVHSFKGLEAAAVIVTDLESVRSTSEQALLYVAVTRAQDRLVLLVSQKAKQDLINALYAGHQERD